MSCLTQTTGSAPQTFAGAIQYFMTAQCLLAPNIVPEAIVQDGDSFDFIVIGAGSAGSVVANRLTEIEKWNVLVLEAGDDSPVEADIPGLEGTLPATKYDWQYFTTDNQITDQALINGSVAWIRGKMLGGSSNDNGMIYMHGNDQDYNKWYKAGNTEWSINDVRRCFKKAESLQDQEKLNDPIISTIYGHNGPLVLNKFNHSMPNVTQGCLDAFNEIGIKNVKDLNLENMGSGRATVTAANGIRQSTNRAYIIPAAERKNLKILKNAFVTKILINDDKMAYGVEVEWNNTFLKLYAKLEVILSAGAINSPLVLMLSGVGPAEHLNANNISCIVDSPQVGQNVQDHLLIPITIYGDSPTAPSPSDKNLDVINYLADRKGTLAHCDVITDVTAFFSTEGNRKYPDSQIHVSIVPKNTHNVKEMFTTFYHYNETVTNDLAEKIKSYSLFSFQYILLHPFSTGNISLKSNNPKDHPTIYPNYLKDPRDMERVIKGIKRVVNVVHTRFFKSIKGFLGRMNIPECNKLKLNSDDYWKCVSKNLVTTIYHQIRSCQMGKDITTSVVDSRLRVHGVKNLRVIDVSVMPNTTSGNTNGPAIMIGERGSELIKEDHNLAF